MNRGRGLILVMAAVFATACASGGGMSTGEAGNRPRDNQHTNAAGVHLAQAGLVEGQEAQAQYQEALQDALEAIQQDSTNPKGYLMAGQASIGLQQWARADTFFTQALDLYPGYERQITAEREQGWVAAYNTGAEALNTGDLDRAEMMFRGADRLYQGRPEARLALGSLSLRQGETERAIQAYRGALEILSNHPPETMDEQQAANWREDRRIAAFNAGQLLADAGNHAEAAEVMEQYLNDTVEPLAPGNELRAKTALAGYLAAAGNNQEAEALFEEILARDDLTSTEYFQIGIGFFNTGQYDRAANAFRSAAELNPYSRDALLNLVQSLYSEALDLEEMEESEDRNQQLVDIHNQILDAAEKVREFDPLNRNLLSFMLRSLRAKAELADAAEADALTRRTQQLYRQYQEQPYEVADIHVSRPGPDQAEITGTLANLTGTAGTEVQLRFAVVNTDGSVIDASTITVAAPEQNAVTRFSTVLDVPGGEFAGWQYEVIQ